MFHRILSFIFIYLLLECIYYHLYLIYEDIITHHKHTSYIYDCLFASCYHENDYIKCKCLLEK